MNALLAYIPSPSSGILHVGPLKLHMYGLTLLVAIILCVWLTSARWKRLGGDSDLVLRVAVWGVAAGVIGARAYHDITSWDEVPTPKIKGIFEIWQGGLGIWGGVLLGTIVGAAVVRRAGANVPAFLDAAAPGLLLAQGIGRIGNWWNQELYGKATSLPWGLRIDQAHRPVASLTQATYHPTFLYELIWDLLGVAFLLWFAKRRDVRAPALFALYVTWYCFGRFFEELLRIDPAHHILGLRLNAWVSVIVFVLGIVAFRRISAGKQAFPRPHRRKKPLDPDHPVGPKMSIPKGRVR